MNRKKIAYAGPGKYVQAEGILWELPDYTMQYGQSTYILMDSFFKETYAVKLQDLYTQKGMPCTIEIFGGENNQTEVDRCCETVRRSGADCVAAFGGGKTLDCGKYISYLLNLPFVSIPTTASTDAPCSALSIVYDGKDHERKVVRCRRNPDLVLVDSRIIAEAPIRFLKAGIGDALATYFEAAANERSGANSFVGQDCVRTRLALAAAVSCYEVLKQYARQAVKDAREQKVTQALEYVIEANILLSGLGFENAGCAGAHSVSGGIGAVDECKGMMHGEKVAFGTLCQVYLERQGEAVLNDLLELCCDLDLPVTLEELGILEEKERKAKLIAEASMDKFWNAEPVAITTDDVRKAVLAVDSLGGHLRKARKQKGDV